MSQVLFEIELFVPSTIEGLNKCLDVISNLKVILDLDLDLVFRLHTVILEAVENAIWHGNKGERELEVRVFISVKKDEILVEIEDCGEGFNMVNILSPIDRVDKEAEGGRGLFFIKMLSSSVYIAGRGNLIRIILERK